MNNKIVGINISNFIYTTSVNKILGLKEGVPLSLEEMRQNLKVTFYQLNPISAALDNFYNTLKQNFEEAGIETLDFVDALDDKGKVKPNIAVFVAGMNDNAKDMMVNFVSSLYNNPIIGLYEGDCPAHHDDSNQEKLNKIITVLAYDVVHVAIFYNENGWTICTMNGAIIDTSIDKDIKDTILSCLVPKLTAQVTPPNILANISYRQGVFDPLQAEFAPVIKDLTQAAKLLKDNGLIMSHTKVSSLKFKNRFHERVIQTYLDHRSGMSYGFMVWQLPIDSRPAILATAEGIEDYYPDGNYIPIYFLGKEYLVETPDVWVLSTRSGCDKTSLDISTDIVRMGLSKGEIILDLPIGTKKEQDVKPSYDTMAILAHALGNSILSSLMKTVLSDNNFSYALDNNGVSLFHWHGYLEKEQLLENHFVHGMENPSVSCSTRQSAVFSLVGKLQALEDCMLQNKEFLGDIHIEPHHGTNISSINKLTEVVTYLHQFYS